MAAPITTVFIPLLLVAVSSYPAHAVTEERGREGDLDVFEDQSEAITQIYGQVYNTIELDRDYGPNQPVAIFSTDLTRELCLHTTFMLFDVVGACAGTRVGTIVGSDLLDSFVTMMLPIIQVQIRGGFGFGMVTVSEDDPNLGLQGLYAQFYYWVERAGDANPGGDTPNTREAKGPFDDDTNRHDELSFILDSPREGPTSLLNETTNCNITSFNNMTYQGRLPHYVGNMTYQARPSHYVGNNKTSNSSKRIRAHKDSTQDFLRYENALFTSLYDINVLTDSSLGDDYPDLIFSQSEEFYLIMQDDCNLVLYQVGSRQKVPIWACTDACFRHGRHCFARINLDGTFAVYNSNGKPLWWTPTQCSSGPGCWSNTYLIMQDDGNLVLDLLDTGVPLWASNTQIYK